MRLHNRNIRIRSVFFDLKLLALCSLFVCLVSSSLSGQAELYTHYGVENGLLTNHVYGCVQDKAGYIWFFTEKGVSKFNGKSFKHFTTKEGLPTNDVWNITIDNQDRKWLHCRSDYYTYIKNDSIYSIKSIDPGYVEFHHMYNKADTVFIYDEKHHIIFGFKDKNWTSFHKIESFFKNNVLLQAAQYDYQSKQEIINNNELYLAENEETTFFAGPNEILINETVSAFTDLKKSKVIILFRNFEQELILNFLDYFDEIPDRVRIISTENKVQISTNLGIILVDQYENIETIRFNKFIKDINVSRSIIDRKGNLWINTLNEGVYQYSSDLQGFRTYSYPYRDFQPYSSLESSGQIYLTDDLGDLVCFEINKDGLLKYKPQYKIGERIFYRSIFRNEFIFNGVGTISDPVKYKHLIRNLSYGIDNLDQFETHYKRNLDYFFEISTRLNLIISESENFYGLFIFGYLMVIDKKTNEAYFSPKTGAPKFEGFLGNNEYLIILDDELLVFDPVKKSVTSVIKFGFKVTSFNTNKNSAIISLENGDIYVYEDGSTVKLDYLNFNSVKDAKIFGPNEYYVLSDIGFFNIKDGLNKCVLNTNRFSLEEFDSFQMYEDNFYLFSKSSIYHFKDSFLESAIKDSVIIEEIQVNGRTVDHRKRIDLKFTENSIQISASLLNYNLQGKYDFDWSLSSGSHRYRQIGDRFSIDNLPPGDYQMSVIAKFADKTSKPGNISFRIDKPYWQKRLFLFGTGLLMAYLFFALFNWRLYVLDQKRLSETKIQSQFTDYELKALRAQMNPHFMFNAMGSIQSLIQSNQKSEADQYLAKFAVLLRSFLDGSRKRTITLKQELDILKKYIEIEELRFGQIALTIENVANLDLEEYRIPSLILQPFVENIFVHAFEADQKDCQIKLYIKEEDNYITIEIIDNGVGIDTTKARSKQLMSRKSLGMNLIQKRLSLLSKEFGSVYSFVVKDRSEYGDSGTKVFLRIPKL